MAVHRPSGVTILAILLMIAAALILIVGTILVNAALQPAYSDLALSNAVGYASYVFLGGPTGNAFTIANISGILSEKQNSIYFFYGLFVSFIIYAGLSVPAVIGLLYMKNWGRILALLVGIFSIIVGVITMFWLVGLILLLFGIFMLVYLAGNVKYEFE